MSPELVAAVSDNVWRFFLMEAGRMDGQTRRRTDDMKLILTSSSSLAFPSCRVAAGMSADLPSPHRPARLLARLLARSQPITFQISLAPVFPPVVLSSSSLQHPSSTLSSVFHLHLSHRTPVPVQSSLRDLFRSLRHSRCSSDAFVPHPFFACQSDSAHPS